jgi:hypothetical protein
MRKYTLEMWNGYVSEENPGIHEYGLKNFTMDTVNKNRGIWAEHTNIRLRKGQKAKFKVAGVERVFEGPVTSGQVNTWMLSVIDNQERLDKLSRI